MFPFFHEVSLDLECILCFMQQSVKFEMELQFLTLKCLMGADPQAEAARRAGFTDGRTKWSDARQMIFGCSAACVKG